MSQPEKNGNALIDSGGDVNFPSEKYYIFFPGIVCTYDLLKGEVDFISSKIFDLLGYTVEEFKALPRNWFDIVVEEDVNLLKEKFENLSLLSEDQSSSFIIRFNNKDAGCKYLNVTATVTETKLGRASRTILFFQNVTDQVRFEEEANDKRQLFDETEKLIIFGSWSWNLNNNKVSWTEGMYQILEYKPEELGEIKDEFYLKHVLTEYIDQLKGIVTNAMSQKIDFEGEYIIRTRYGKEKFVYTKGTPIFDKDGNVKKYVGITRDITHKKNAEKDKERRIRELNRSNKELEEFAYVASHDMHEPLRKILTFGEKINTKYASALGDDGKIYLDRIVSSANNMRNLIDNLLEFSKITRGARSFVPADLNEIISQVLSDQELRIEETGTKVGFNDLPTVEGVPSEMRQLFNNLLSNAIKFRKKDESPTIKFTSHKLSHKEKAELFIPFNQTYFKISIQDNGIGFESIYSEKIFEIFQRLNGKSEYAGSGIGLAICKKIVESHDGIILAAGEPGIGSTFHVILPETQYH